jgi:hypothetical protein
MLTEEPVLVLENEQAVFLALMQPDGEVCSVRRPVKSLWICDLIREIAAQGRFPYNQDVYELAEKKLGLPKTSHHSTGKRETLSWLVHYAQGYREADDLRAMGYQPLTQALVDEACRQGRKIEIHLGEPAIVMSGCEPETTAVYNVRAIGEKCYAMPPKSRNRALRVDGQPAKLV